MTEIIEIEELVEGGGDGGDLLGYYCRGHVDRLKFSEAANQFSGAVVGYDVRHVMPHKVEHKWWRCVPVAGEPGQISFHHATPHARGAFAVTVCESVYDGMWNKTLSHIRECERQREAGFCEGLNWALRQLDHIDPKAGEKLLKAYRAKDYQS